MNANNEKVRAEIGEDYKRWDSRDCIFIDAPTGSGKTTFILKTLLPYFCRENKKILYLVNRRILKKQLEDMILDLPYEQNAAIEIGLYQEIEKGICSIQNSKRHKRSRGDSRIQEYSNSQLEKFSNCDCVVCDECHYFLTDSNYNTNTSFSFYWIQAKFRDKLSIFMSATCGDIRSYIQKNNFYKPEAGYTKYYNFCSPKENSPLREIREKKAKSLGEEVQELEALEKRPIKSYSIKRRYDYIDANNIWILNEKENIVDLVVEGNGKWLIFIDNIKYGRKLKNAIKRKFRALAKEKHSENIDSKVIMISAGYKRDIESDREVNHIIETSVPLAKVLIATSVLDNGVNIKDSELRNVILFADTETEFIQMLGRKREEEKQFKLYIYRYDKNHFCKRKQQLKRRKKMARGYLEYFESQIKSLRKSDEVEDWNEGINLSSLNDCEKECIERQHIKLMQDLSDNYIKYKDVSSVFTVYDGTWYINRLAAQNIENLNVYYNEIIDKFEVEGKEAFVRKQLYWLGKDKEADDIIMRSKTNRATMAFDQIETRIRETGMKWMEKNEYDELMKEMKWELQDILGTVDKEELPEKDKKFYTTVYNAIYQTTTHVTPEHVKFLDKYCGFPFQLEESKREESGKKVPIFKFGHLEEIEDDKK